MTPPPLQFCTPVGGAGAAADTSPAAFGSAIATTPPCPAGTPAPREAGPNPTPARAAPAALQIPGGGSALGYGGSGGISGVGCGTDTGGGVPAEGEWPLCSPEFDDTPRIGRKLSVSSPLPLSPPEASGATLLGITSLW